MTRLVVTALSPREGTWKRLTFATVAVLVAALPFAAPADATARRPTQSVDGALLELVGQEFAVDPNGEFQLRYLLSGLVGDPLQLVAPEPPVVDPAAPVEPPVQPAPEPLQLTMLVVNYPALTDVDDVAPLVGSDVDPGAFDRVAGNAIDGIAFDARPLLVR
ncbi:MAG: hypothetical protein ACM3MM_02430, partial [Acidobacteriota bacterium]